MPKKKNSHHQKLKTPQVFKSEASSHLPTALVAGAAGFIGSHLCDALLSQNCRVYGIDNWSTGKKRNIKHLLKNDKFVFLEHDLNLPLKAPLPQIDYLFHLAGVEAYVNGLDMSLETLLVNSLGTKELLEIAKANHAKFLLASTINIFSGQLSSHNLEHYFGDSHFSEEAYSHHEAKRFSEALTFEYVNRHQLDARIVRLGYVYGPRMDFADGNEISQLFLSAKNNSSLKLKNQGLTPLYPTYISDIIYGLTKAMFSQSSHYQIFTLVNPEKTTTLNLAYKLKQLITNKNLTIEFDQDTEITDTVSLSEIILDSQKQLGWSPTVTLEEGIQKTLKWLGRQNLSSTIHHSKKQEAGNSEQEPVYTPESLGITPAPAQIPLSRPSRILKPLPKLNFHFRLPKFKSFPHPSKPFKLSLRPKEHKRKFKFKFFFFALLALFLYLTVPLTLMAVFAYRGAQNLNQISQLTDVSQISNLENLTQKSQTSFQLSRRFLTHANLPLILVGQKSLSQNLDRLLFIGIKLSQGAQHLAKAGESGTLLSEIIFHHQDANLTQAIKLIQLNLDQAYSELSFVESELQSGQQLNLDISASLAQKMQTLTTHLPNIRSTINQARAVLPLVPSLIAQESKKTYLLLFQNSAEIRPTGGFIGSYGLLTFDKGKLLDFTVEDIYAADGQLKGFVEPPTPIKQYLGQNTWYFRDSNWDPDFTVSAQRAEWFLNKTTGRNVDGVIAVNLPAVKELLAATGPIKIEDYDEDITAENLFDRAEYHSEIDFFPGSTQKKDFLGSLARELFSKIENMSAGDLLKISQGLESALVQKQLLIYLHDQPAQKILLEQNWAGAIFEPQLSTVDNRPVTADYSYLVEANLGINKANYFLTRNIKHNLTILKTRQILVTSTITYHNQSPADAWPGGTYRSYVRDYLPENATLISVKSAENKLSAQTIDQEVINHKLVIGFPVTVPVKQSLDIEITYRLEDPFKLVNNLGRLSIVIPKQPGTLSDSIEVIVNHPSFLSPAAVSPQALISSQVVTFKTQLLTDQVFNLDFVEN